MAGFYAEWAARLEGPAGGWASMIYCAGDSSAHFATEGDAAAAGVCLEQGVVGAEVFGRDAGGVGAVALEHGPAPFVGATGSTPLAVVFHIGLNPRSGKTMSS